MTLFESLTKALEPFTRKMLMCAHMQAHTHLVCHFRVFIDLLPKRSEAPMLKTPAIKMRNVLLKRTSLAFNEIMTFTLTILFVDLTI